MSDTSNSRNLIIYGGGGHGLVTAEAAALSGWSVLGFVDSAKPAGTPVGQWQVLDACQTHAAEDAACIVAIGDNHDRATLIDALVKMSKTLGTVIHPAAIVSDSAEIADGVFIGPRAVVHSEAVVEQGAIINTGAIIEHHNHIGRCAHVAPGATLCGRVTVGDQAMVGANATAIPFVTIGARTVVGAGAVVIDNIADETTALGTPARAV